MSMGGKVYTRRCYGSDWTDWESLVKKSDTIPYYNVNIAAGTDKDDAIKQALNSTVQSSACILRVYIPGTCVFLFTAGCVSDTYSAYGVMVGDKTTMLQTVFYVPGVDYKRSSLPSTP